VRARVPLLFSDGNSDSKVTIVGESIQAHPFIVPPTHEELQTTTQRVEHERKGKKQKSKKNATIDHRQTNSMST
jgi:hypothetical protein